jgi:hypothetical protein
VTNKDDAASWGQGCLYYTNNVWDREAGEQGPHGKVLESGRRGGELIAQGVILHVDANQIIESGGWEAEYTRYFLGMEEIRCLVPVNPHATEVIA